MIFYLLPWKLMGGDSVHDRRCYIGVPFQGSQPSAAKRESMDGTCFSLLLSLPVNGDKCYGGAVRRSQSCVYSIASAKLRKTIKSIITWQYFSISVKNCLLTMIYYLYENTYSLIWQYKYSLYDNTWYCQSSLHIASQVIHVVPYEITCSVFKIMHVVVRDH